MLIRTRARVDGGRGRRITLAFLGLPGPSRPLQGSGKVYGTAQTVSLTEGRTSRRLWAGEKERERWKAVSGATGEGETTEGDFGVGPAPAVKGCRRRDRERDFPLHDPAPPRDTLPELFRRPLFLPT